MIARIGLSDTARQRLIEFCADVLKPGLDPITYADGFQMDNFGAPGDTAGVHYEVRLFDTKSGRPETIVLYDDEDFDTAEIED